MVIIMMMVMLVMVVMVVMIDDARDDGDEQNAWRKCTLIKHEQVTFEFTDSFLKDKPLARKTLCEVAVSSNKNKYTRVRHTSVEQHVEAW